MDNNKKNNNSFSIKLLLLFGWLRNWISSRQDVRRFYRHVKDYPWVWIVFIIIFLSSWIIVPMNWAIAKWAIRIALILFIVLLLKKPMNAVFGLMGSEGSIGLFFANFIGITLVFAGIYHFGAFQNAGISYDINQPHIDFNMFANSSLKDSARISEKKDTLFLEHKLDSISFNETVIRTTTDTLHYQKIEFMQVWRSTILTTLTQEASDLFVIASIHNAAIESGNVDLDQEESDLFEWILIFHIIISWIFFGVFISLLYNKFRYES